MYYFLSLVEWNEILPYSIAIMMKKVFAFLKHVEA